MWAPFVLRLAAAGTQVWTRSDDFCHRLIPKSLAARRRVCGGLRGAQTVFVYVFKLRRIKVDTVQRRNNEHADDTQLYVVLSTITRPNDCS